MRVRGYIIAAALVAATFGGQTATAQAQGTESPELSKARDGIVARRCHKQGAPMNVCTALVIGARKAKVPRRWAANPRLLARLRMESGFDQCAVNPSRHLCYYLGSNACGLFQRYKCPWRQLGGRKMLIEQCRNGMAYVASRYGRPGKIPMGGSY